MLTESQRVAFVRAAVADLGYCPGSGLPPATRTAYGRRGTCDTCGRRYYIRADGCTIMHQPPGAKLRRPHHDSAA